MRCRAPQRQTAVGKISHGCHHLRTRLPRHAEASVRVSWAIDCLGWPIDATRIIVIIIILRLLRVIKLPLLLLLLLQGTFESLCVPAMLKSYPLRPDQFEYFASKCHL